MIAETAKILRSPFPGARADICCTASSSDEPGWEEMKYGTRYCSLPASREWRAQIRASVHYLRTIRPIVQQIAVEHAA